MFIDLTTSTPAVTLSTWALAVALGAALVAAGCGSSDDPAPAAATTRPTAQAPQLPAELAGRWSRRLTRADLRRTERYRKEGPGQQAPAPGRQQLVLAEGSPQASLAISDAQGDAEGLPPIAMDALATDGGELRLPTYVDPANGTLCGHEVPSPAHYRWRVEQDRLTLKPVREGCADRDAILTGTWSRP
jgi:hypothetical protein